MESKQSKIGHEEINKGVDALNQGQRDVAARHFDTALEQFELIESDVERCRELGVYALWIDQAGFPDIALMAAQEAASINQKFGDDAQMAEDLNTCGIAQMHLGNNEEALELYRQAYSIFISKNKWASAASTYTNMALIIGNTGEMNEAIRMMYKSIDYLSKQSLPPTEIITRIALVQALTASQRPPEEIFNVAKPIAQFSHELRPDQWEGLRGPLSIAVKRYIATHPNTDPERVISEYIPGLF